MDIKKEILIVDDEYILSRSLIDILETNNFTVYYAQDCSQALKTLKTRKNIKVAILDCMLPYGPNATFIEKMSNNSSETGLSLAKYIKAIRPEIEIIGYSALPENRVKNSFESLGGLYFRKGFDNLIKLVQCLNFVFERGSLPKERPKIFIVHGHNEKLKNDLVEYLRNFSKHWDPIVLKEMPGVGKTIIEKFEHFAGNTNIVFILLNGDDLVEVVSSNEKYLQPRANVLFELGYFFGKLERASGKIILLKTDEAQLPSDLNGVQTINATNGIFSAAGYFVNELKQYYNNDNNFLD